MAIGAIVTPFCLKYATPPLFPYFWRIVRQLLLSLKVYILQEEISRSYPSYFSNIFIRLSSFLITISIRFGIERIKFFTVTLPVHALQTQRQYSSQIVETDTVSLEFSGKILRFLLHTIFPPEICLLPPQC